MPKKKVKDKKYKDGGVACSPTKDQLAYNAKYDALKKIRDKKKK